MTYRFGRFVVASALLMHLAGCGTATPPERHAMHESSTPATAALLQRIGLDLPASATIEHVASEAGMDDSAKLMIVMSAGDRTLLLRQISLKAGRDLTFSADDNFLLGNDSDAWRSSRTAGLQTGQVPWAHGTESLNVGIIPAANTGQTSVFVFWHQT